MSIAGEERSSLVSSGSKDCRGVGGKTSLVSSGSGNWELGCGEEDQPCLVRVRGLSGRTSLITSGEGMVGVWRGEPASSRRGRGIVGVLWYASVTEVSDLNPFAGARAVIARMPWARIFT